jgi:hypothetical protein
MKFVSMKTTIVLFLVSFFPLGILIQFIQGKSEEFAVIKKEPIKEQIDIMKLYDQNHPVMLYEKNDDILVISVITPDHKVSKMNLDESSLLDASVDISDLPNDTCYFKITDEEYNQLQENYLEVVTAKQAY